MPAGLQVYDSNGVLVIDTSERLSRFLGTYQNGTDGNSAPYSGQIILPSYPTNSYWWAPKFLGRGTNSPLAGAYPVFTLNGTTLSWVYSLKLMNGTFNVPFILFYGVY